MSRNSLKNRGTKTLVQRCLWGVVVGMMTSVLGGCPPSLYINNSFRQSSIVPVAAGMISLSRGETIEIKDILKKEGITVPKPKQGEPPFKVVVTRLFGAYLLTGPGFQYVWRIQPTGREKASYTKIVVPGVSRLTNPKFKHSESHNCVTLVVGGQGSEKSWQIHPSGAIGEKCHDVSSN